MQLLFYVNFLILAEIDFETYLLFRP